MIVLITGASSGIGCACSERFASEGYDLIVTGRRLSRLEDLKKKLEDKYNIKVCVLNFDIQDKVMAHKALEGLNAQWRNIDILINNAGLALGKGPIHESDIQDFEVMIDTNVKGLLYVSNWVMNGMKKMKSGHIINLSSTAAKEVYPGGHVYCASKHAVDAITKGMRLDLLPFGIKVSSVSPGMVETEFSKVRFKGDGDKAKSVYQGFVPLYAADVADAIYYVANLPKNVNVNDLVLTSTAQANSYVTFKDN